MPFVGTFLCLLNHSDKHHVFYIIDNIASLIATFKRYALVSSLIQVFKYYYPQEIGAEVDICV